jgi:hypothetical protein
VSIAASISEIRMGASMSITLRASIGILFACSVVVAPRAAIADEGGVSFWIPGFFGSLAATPQQPGWSFTTIFYHTSVTAGADVAFARQVHRGNLQANFTGNLNINLKAPPDLQMFMPSYTLATPVLGGQAAFYLLGLYGRNPTTVSGTLTGSLGVGPGFTIGGSRTDTTWGWGDLLPIFTLKWNKGVDNYMVYITGDIPVGAYDPNRLANLGLGHGAIDAGGGYTYFNPQTGHEFSAVLGFTYNFENTFTNYENGIDMHLDWGISQFLTKEWQLGFVGYLYDQLSCDSGSGDRVGCFESRVIGVGPQIGHIFKISDDYQGYVNLKGYREFDAAHRPDGWNVWATFVISPAEQEKPPETKRPRIVK